MSERTPPPDEASDDAAFDAIVASFNAPSAPHAGSDRLGETETAPPPPSTSATAAAEAGGWDDLVTGLEEREAARRAAADEAAAAEERYVPPPPPPLPRSDALGTLSWVGVIAAPVLWMVLSLFGWPFESWQLLLLVAVFLGSFGVLVARMRHGGADDEPDDNGAVV